MTASASKVHFGLEGLTIFFEDATEQDGYEAPTTIPGIVGFNRTAQTNSTKFYADNTTYYVVNDDKGDEAELETAGIPKAILARMLGWYVDSKGALVRVTDGKPEHFAMAYRVEGDQAARAQVCYDCCAKVPDQSNATLGESVDVQTETITLDIVPKVINGHKTVSVTLDESDDATAFAGFFDSVYTPVPSNG